MRNRITILIFPVVGSVYFIISEIFGLPSTIFLGGMLICTVILCVALRACTIIQDGQIVIMNENGKKVFSLELDKDPNDLKDHEYVFFKVTDSRGDGHDSQV